MQSEEKRLVKPAEMAAAVRQEARSQRSVRAFGPEHGEIADVLESSARFIEDAARGLEDAEDALTNPDLTIGKSHARVLKAPRRALGKEST